MRILLVCDVNAMNTGGDIHFSLVKGILEERGHDVGVFTCGHTSGGICSYFSRFFNVKDYLKMRKVLSVFKPDIVHAHGIHTCLSPSPLIAASRHVPVVITLHDYHYVCPKVWMIYSDDEVCKYGFGMRCLLSRCPPRKNILYEWVRWTKVGLHRKMLRGCVDVFVSPSCSLAKWISKSLDVEAQAIPNFGRIARQSKLPLPDNRTILCVARLSLEKGVHYLLRAMPRICSNVPDVRLIVVGDGPEEENLRKMAEELGIGDRVTFMGWVEHDKVADLYRETMMVVVPSVWAENFGSVAVEAVCTGRPVVAANIGGLPEIVKDGENGYLVEPRNAEDLAEKVTRILDDPELASQMGRKAEEYASGYNRTVHAKRLELLYQSLLSSSWE